MVASYHSRSAIREHLRGRERERLTAHPTGRRRHRRKACRGAGRLRYRAEYAALSRARRRRGYGGGRLRSAKPSGRGDLSGRKSCRAVPSARPGGSAVRLSDRSGDQHAYLRGKCRDTANQNIINSELPGGDAQVNPPCITNRALLTNLSRAGE